MRKTPFGHELSMSPCFSPRPLHHSENRLTMGDSGADAAWILAPHAPASPFLAAWSRREDGRRSQDIPVLKCMLVGVTPDLLADRNVRAPFCEK